MIFGLTVNNLQSRPRKFTKSDFSGFPPPDPVSSDFSKQEKESLKIRLREREREWASQHTSLRQAQGC